MWLGLKPLLKKLTGFSSSRAGAGRPVWKELEHSEFLWRGAAVSSGRRDVDMVVVAEHETERGGLGARGTTARCGALSPSKVYCPKCTFVSGTIQSVGSIAVFICLDSSDEDIDGRSVK